MPVDAGTVSAQVRVNTAALRADLLNANNQLTQFGTTGAASISKFSKSSIAAFGAIGLSIAAVIKIIQGLKSAINTFAEFEQAMANVSSVAKATPEDFEKLKAAAEDAGAATRFTASQAANALYYLASAGFSATDSIAALNGVLYLAGSTQSDLASTSEAVASAISQFSLKSTDATKVANVYTAAITNSQATMAKLTTSMRYVGPVASAMNHSIEETVGLLQILYNNGFEASQAGTALRGSLADLSNETSPAIEKLAALGVSFEEVNPATNSFADIIDVLNRKVTDAGDIMAIFGDRAGPAMIKLIQAGREEVIKYTEAVTDTNAAAEAYIIQNDTLAGSQDRFKSATEALAIAFGEQLAPFLRDVLEIGIKLLNWLTDSMPAISEFISRLVFPVIGIADFFAQLAKGSTVADQYRSDLDDIALGLAGVNETIEATKGIQSQRKELDDLISEYETLTNKTSLNATEQERLNVVIGLLSKSVPDAATAFDKFGNAVGINTEIAKQASLDLLKLEKTNKEAALATVEAERWIADERKKSLEFVRQSRKEEFEVSQKRLQQISNDFNTAKSIENEYFTAKKKAEIEAGDDYELYTQRLQKAQADTAKKLLESGFIDEAQFNKVLNNQLSIVQLLNTEVVPLEQSYADITKQVDEQYKSWQEVEGQYQRSNELLLEIKQTEADIAALDTGINQIEALKGDITETNTEKTQEQLQAEEEAEKKRLEMLAERESFEAEYHRKYLEQGGERLELLDLEYQEAIAKAEQLGADTMEIEAYYAEERKRIKEEAKEEEKNEEENDLNNFIDILETKAEAFKKNYQNYSEIALNFFSALATLRQADTQKQISALRTQTDALIAEIDKREQAELESNGLLEESQIIKLRRQLAEAIASGDAETIAQAQDALDREIIEQKYEDERIKIQEDAKRKEADLQYRGELAAWKFKLLAALAAAPITIINAMNTGFGAGFPAGLVLGPALAAVAAVSTGIQIAAINKSKPQKPKFETGGIVLSGSRTGTDVTVAENGYNEMMLSDSPRGESFTRRIAGIVADEVIKRGFPMTFLFDIDGRRIAENSADYYNNNIVRLTV